MRSNVSLLMMVVACLSFSTLAVQVNVHGYGISKRCWRNDWSDGDRTAASLKWGRTTRGMRCLCSLDFQEEAMVVINLTSCFLPGLKVGWNQWLGMDLVKDWCWEASGISIFKCFIIETSSSWQHLELRCSHLQTCWVSSWDHGVWCRQFWYDQGLQMPSQDSSGTPLENQWLSYWWWWSQSRFGPRCELNLQSWKRGHTGSLFAHLERILAG